MFYMFHYLAGYLFNFEPPNEIGMVYMYLKNKYDVDVIFDLIIDCKLLLEFAKSICFKFQYFLFMIRLSMGYSLIININYKDIP